MIARFALREATSEDHRQVDDIFSRFELGSSPGYRAFLRALAAAQLPVEAALDEAGAGRIVADWPQRRRAELIREDLADLGEECPEGRALASFTDDAELLGAIYVLEGSRLGGALLKRSVPAGLPLRFLNAPASSGSWRRLSDLLDQRLPDRQSVERAIISSRQVFAAFAAAGLAQLEPQE